MHRLTKLSRTMGIISLSTLLFMGHSVAVTPTETSDTSKSKAQSSPKKDSIAAVISAVDVNPETTITASNDITEPVTDDASITSATVTETNKTILDDRKIMWQMNKYLPSIVYNTENLSKVAQQVNTAIWKKDAKLDRNIGTKLQALLNWQNHGVGAVDGYWGKNTRKAMQSFQKARGLTVTDTLNEETWQELTKDEKLYTQPVLVQYTLTDQDVNIKTTTIPSGAAEKAKLEGMYYESMLEALAEKFRMDESYLRALNPNATYQSGDNITVYNPKNAPVKSVNRVVADKTTQTLYAYDKNDVLIASYPTTVGSLATPSPTGTHTIKVKVHEPNYTYTHEDGSKSIIPPGPNNPVGEVWIGLSEPSYGIHGSPDPSRISRQASAGCVRLTNWDALALLSTIEDEATVEFI